MLLNPRNYNVLQMPAAVNLMNSTDGDVALRLNATVLAGALVEGGEKGPPAFLQAEGTRHLCEACHVARGEFVVHVMFML